MFLVIFALSIPYTHNSNKFMQQKQGGYFAIAAVHAVSHQTISNVSMYELIFTAVY